MIRGLRWAAVAAVAMLGGGQLGAGAAEVPEALTDALKEAMPGVEVELIRSTPVAGLYEVQLAGRVFYFTEDGRYLMRGDLIDVQGRQNLTEMTRRDIRLAMLDRLGEGSMVVFAPEQSKHTITVFTDVDCPYCARLHREVPKLNEAGIKVRYAAFPRAGLKSKSFRTMVSVWCAQDPLQAMTDAKAQRPVDPAECENTIPEHYDAGRALGISGTPTIILDDGRLVGGYRPYRALIQLLEEG